MRKTVVLVLALAICSCTSLSRSEREVVRELKDYGIRSHETVKHPAAAGLLNILPGFGNFYLAVGTDESEHWLFGFLNPLAWPVSVVWGIPEAAIDAGNINQREMAYYYTRNPQGMNALAELRARARGGS